MVVETKTIFISTAVLFFYNFALCKLKVLLHFTVLCFFEFVECEGVKILCSGCFNRRGIVGLLGHLKDSLSCFSL